MREQLRRQWQFKCSGHTLYSQAIPGDAIILEALHATTQQFIHDFLVEARGGDGDACIGWNISGFERRRLRAHVKKSRTRSPCNQCLRLRAAEGRLVDLVAGRVAGVMGTSASEIVNRVKTTVPMVVSFPGTGTMACVLSSFETRMLSSRLALA